MTPDNIAIINSPTVHSLLPELPAENSCGQMISANLAVSNPGNQRNDVASALMPTVSRAAKTTQRETRS